MELHWPFYGHLKSEVIGASPFPWPSPSRWSIKRRTTRFHWDIWFWKLHNSPSSWKPLWFWNLHHIHPAATAGCMWGVVDGKTNLHRLLNTQRKVWSVVTRNIHQRTAWRWSSRCDQHGGARSLHYSQHDHLFPAIRFWLLDSRTNNDVASRVWLLPHQRLVCHHTFKQNGQCSRVCNWWTILEK